MKFCERCKVALEPDDVEEYEEIEHNNVLYFFCQTCDEEFGCSQCLLEDTLKLRRGSPIDHNGDSSCLAYGGKVIDDCQCEHDCDGCDDCDNGCKCLFCTDCGKIVFDGTRIVAQYYESGCTLRRVTFYFQQFCIPCGKKRGGL